MRAGFSANSRWMRAAPGKPPARAPPVRRTFWMAAQVAARQRDNSFRDKLGRYTAGHADDADRRRKAMTALTAKMARVAHAVIKTGTEYRPFLERSDARWKDPSLQVP